MESDLEPHDGCIFTFYNMQTLLITLNRLFPNGNILSDPWRATLRD